LRIYNLPIINVSGAKGGSLREFFDVEEDDVIE
jgi:hypothetical protein